MPQFPEIEYQLYNYINVKEFPVSSNAIQTVAKQDAGLFKINKNIKIAVVSDQIVMAGLTNMYKVHFELSCNDVAWETQIFKTENDAREWLNT